MPIAKLLLTLSLTLILAGCAGPSTRHRDTPLIAEASERFRNGDYAGASQIYQRLAERSDDADYYRLLAADAELRAGNDRAARALLGAINADDLEEGDRQRYALLRARIDLNQGNAREAMARLDGINYQLLTSPLRAHYHTLRASAYNQLGNWLESARERVFYGQLTSNPEAIQKNNEAIYDALNRLPYPVLTSLQPGTQGTLGGWMALDIALRSPEANRAQAVQAWRAKYPGHPANGAFVEGFSLKKGKPVAITALKPANVEPATPAPAPVQAAPAAAPQAVAPTSAPAQAAPLAASGFVGVMLPLTGTYAQAAQAVRLGLSAAWNADTNPTRPELRFVDTQGGDVGSVYRKLVEEGARFVIGPLLKEEVATLARGGDFTVPVLALNQSPEANNRAGLYQFALTPEQEVEQSASLAWFDGRQNALLLAPTSAFGQRMISHFSSYWKSLGGKIANIKTYQPGAADYSDTAKRLVANVAGEVAAPESAATPEFIFMIADSRDGRLLNPHIENQESQRIPVYATSLIFNGQPAAPQNADLSGVTFCDSPWLLDSDGGALSRQAMQAAAQQTPEVYLRLLPMGIDAYQLIGELNALKNGGQSRFSGATGVLTLRGNKLNRQLHCAQFEGGTLQQRGIAPTLQPSALPASP
jgi:outer membrane PBP1 activator LpoA protein